jgi:Uma2 family endonuclease
MPTYQEPPKAPGTVAEAPSSPIDEPTPPSYDRSSLTGDYLVMIAGQTEEDYFRYAPENKFCEYIDGIVYMPSPVTDHHQEITVFLTDLLNGSRWERGTGHVLPGPALLRVAPKRCLEPDIFVLPVGVKPGRGVGWAIRTAVLVVEVLSPSNRSYDLDFKAQIYRDAGIAELWFVDSRDRVLFVERREGEAYQSLRLIEGIHRSSALPGFWIDVSWLWADPLPNPRRCLEAILAGPPPT